MRSIRLAALAMCWLVASSVHADVVIVNNYSSWSAALGGGDAKMDFIGQSGFLSDQYAYLGAQFLPGGTVTVNTALGDGWAIAATFPGGNKITIDFATGQYGVGLDLLNSYKASLYYQGELLFASGTLNISSGVFRGLLSTSAFDRVVFEPVGLVVGKIDNVYVGNPIPAPGVGVILGLSVAVAGVRRRRREGLVARLRQ